MCTRIMHTLFTGTGLRNKFLLLFVFIISATLCLSSCSFQDNTPDVIVEYQIPFAKSGSRWNEIELIDEDSFGRKMYSYKSESYCTNVFRDYMGINYKNAPVLIYIIVQKKDRNFVYCYDDYCYTYVKSFEDDNSDIIENLKEINDWEKSIDEDKFLPLSIKIGSNEISKYKVVSVETTAVTTLEETVACEIEDYYLDAIFLEDATPIFVLREVTNREKHEFGKSFVFHISDDRSEATYLELCNDIQNWNEEIHNFKLTLTQARKTGDGSLS